MSNISRFPVSEEESAGKRINKTLRHRKLTRVYKVMLLLLAVSAIIVAYMIYEKTKVYETYTVTFKAPRSEIGGTETMEFNGNILSFSKDGAGAMDSSGKLLWNQTFDMQNPMASVCGGTAAFADYGGSTVYLQTEGGYAGTITTDKPIRKITVSEKGYVAAVLEDTNVTWIYIYDMNGTEIAYFRTTMEKSGYPVDLDISPNGELVCVSYYYVDIRDIKSSVAFYNFGPVGQNNIDNYVSGYNYPDTLVPLVRFLDSDTAFSLSPSRMSVYSGSHKPVSISDMFINDEILASYCGKDVIAVIYRNNSTENRYKLVLYSDTGKALSAREFDFDYTGVSFGNGNYILYGDTSVYIASYSGEKRYEGNYSEAIRLAIPTRVASKYIFVTSGSIDTVEFK